MTELLLMGVGGIITVGLLAFNEALTRAKNSSRVGMPASGSAVIQSTRRLEVEGTVLDIEVFGEWGEPLT